MGAPAELFEVPEPRQLADDEVLIEVMAAAAFPVPALTARQVLVDALGLHAGEQLLVNGAGGATGGLLVALAVLHGAQVIATAGPASRQRVAALGAGHVIDYHDPDWPSQARASPGTAE
jgi:NADPH:quinone reductase-like Zn-dependent oxidoreductase